MSVGRMLRTASRLVRRAGGACMLAAAVALGAATATADAPRGTPRATAVVGAAATARAVESVGMTVADAERSIAFYRDVLGFRVIGDVELAGERWEHVLGLFAVRARVVRLRLGAEDLELTEFLAPRGRPIPVDSRSHDRWFQHVAIVVRDMDRAYAHLRRHRVEHASSGPQRLPDWNPRAAGIRAFYFKDPDGHPLEVIEFPRGKGDARWHEPGDHLFLGIDHTAIVVRDTEASLAYYRGALGLAVAGESENHGTEQEHLNNVFGARLRITTLRAAAGPGIELLEYLAPRDGRPYPPDGRANDLLHWQTRVAIPDPAAAALAARRAGGSLVSPGAVALPDRGLGFATAATVRDPDGHALQLVAR